ncbi:hypothetical protein G6F32_014755 [Rhizopus arrhizus]|nr:hypothetical protein G6F32_014755 [Rhizopus arrhizus]
MEDRVMCRSCSCCSMPVPIPNGTTAMATAAPVRRGALRLDPFHPHAARAHQDAVHVPFPFAVSCRPCCSGPAVGLGRRACRPADPQCHRGGCRTCQHAAWAERGDPRRGHRCRWAGCAAAQPVEDRPPDRCQGQVPDSGPVGHARALRWRPGADRREQGAAAAVHRARHHHRA